MIIIEKIKIKIKVKNKNTKNKNIKDKYCPIKVGIKAYRNGLGISDLWGATKTDEDTDIAIEAYIKEKEKDAKTIL